MGTDWKHMFDDFLESAMDDSEAEQECYRIVAMFDEIESEIADFYIAMVDVFGGFTWFNDFGKALYSPHSPQANYADKYDKRPVTDYTCHRCVEVEKCCLAWDWYNLDGDCLMLK